VKPSFTVHGTDKAAATLAGEEQQALIIVITFVNYILILLNHDCNK
jgi:hypothetical protein